MRSDRHRVIAPEPAPTDDTGELMLPDELAELAEQLRHDASYLSECYPSRDFVECSRSFERGWRVKGRLRRWLLAGGVAASVVVVLAGAFIQTAKDTPDQQRQAGQSLAITADVDGVPESQRPWATTDPPSRVSTDMVRLGAVEEDIDTVAPVVLPRDLSGPELEGLLDLLDSQSVAISSVSI